MNTVLAVPLPPPSCLSIAASLWGLMENSVGGIVESIKYALALFAGVNWGGVSAAVAGRGVDERRSGGIVVAVAVSRIVEIICRLV